MVERRLLTEDFVNSLEPPLKGERWVADTKVRGFGLRLWAAKDGGQAAFAIRVSDQSGKSIRRTFYPWTGAFMMWRCNLESKIQGVDLSRGLPMGIFLEDAREWSSIEIGRLKGHVLTESEQRAIDEEYRAGRRSFEKRLRRLTLEEAADSIIRGGYSRGLSAPYGDRLLKIFYNYAPLKLRKLTLQYFWIEN